MQKALVLSELAAKDWSEYYSGYSVSSNYKGTQYSGQLSVSSGNFYIADCNWMQYTACCVYDSSSSSAAKFLIEDCYFGFISHGSQGLDIYINAGGEVIQSRNVAAGLKATSDIEGIHSATYVGQSASFRNQAYDCCVAGGGTLGTAHGIFYTSNGQLKYIRNNATGYRGHQLVLFVFNNNNYATSDIMYSNWAYIQGNGGPGTTLTGSAFYNFLYCNFIRNSFPSYYLLNFNAPSTLSYCNFLENTCTNYLLYRASYNMTLSNCYITGSVTASYSVTILNPVTQKIPPKVACTQVAIQICPKAEPTDNLLGLAMKNGYVLFGNLMSKMAVNAPF